MGYTTEFRGKFTLNKPLTQDQCAYLTAFAQTRRMKRNTVKTVFMPDPVREAAGLPLGKEGAYFVGSPHNWGQDETPDIIDYNHPPTGQPGLWCQWTPTEDGNEIKWNGTEKFYCYVEWLQYLIQNFLAPWGYILNGAVEWQGEEHRDKGCIIVSDNVVTTKTGYTVYW